jgi:glycopeptide antibiotics resistance protein
LLFIPWAFLGPYIKHKYSSNKQYHAAAVRWLFIGLIFSSAAEVIQYFLQYRAYNINDLLANSIGVLLGFTIFTTLIIFKYKFNKI